MVKPSRAEIPATEAELAVLGRRKGRGSVSPFPCTVENNSSYLMDFSLWDNSLVPPVRSGEKSPARKRNILVGFWLS